MMTVTRTTTRTMMTRTMMMRSYSLYNCERFKEGPGVHRDPRALTFLPARYHCLF